MQHSEYHHHAPHNDAHHTPHQTTHRNQNKRDLLIGVLIGLLVIAGAAIGMQTKTLKGLLTENISRPAAQTPAPVVAERSVTLSINDMIILTAEPALGFRVEKELKDGAEIGKIKLQNNGAESITLNEIKFADRGFATSAPVYELFMSKENSEKYEKIGSSSGAPEFKLETPVAVSASAYRNLSVRIKSAENLEKGNIFMLELKSLGNLGLGQNGTMRLGAVMMK